MSPMAWKVRTAWSQSTRSTTTTACRACLFYHDLDANGRLIFNVNDFDEAYVGPFTWDLKRFTASVALIGYAKALGDEITELVEVYAGAYRERIHALAAGAKSDEAPPFTLDTGPGPDPVAGPPPGTVSLSPVVGRVGPSGGVSDWWVQGACHNPL
jgi:hypothetical protein